MHDELLAAERDFAAVAWAWMLGVADEDAVAAAHAALVAARAAAAEGEES